MQHLARTHRWHFTTAGLVLTVLLIVTFRPAVATATDLSGTWTGHWRSHTNGHEGPMKATFEPINGCQYRVRFSGWFWKIIPFCYTETLDVLCDDGQTVQLAASSRLCVFGMFNMRAAANCCHFQANYSSESDQGYFSLRRTE